MGTPLTVVGGCSRAGAPAISFSQRSRAASSGETVLAESITQPALPAKSRVMHSCQFTSRTTWDAIQPSAVSAPYRPAVLPSAAAPALGPAPSFARLVPAGATAPVPA